MALYRLCQSYIKIRANIAAVACNDLALSKNIRF